MARKPVERPSEPLYPEHPKSEHEWRLDRARTFMEEDGIDALLLGRNVHVFYMTGSRFVFVGWDGPNALSPQSTAIVTQDDDVYCQRFGPFDSDEVGIHTTNSESLEYYDDEMEVVNILRDYGVGEGDTVGTEWGTSGLTNDINPLKFLKLKARIEDELGATVVDANPTINKTMVVKSDLEIERMRTAVEAAANAMNRLYEGIELGMNELDVSQRVSKYMIEEGGQKVSHAQVMGGADGIKLRSCDPVDRPLEEGWVHLDIGCIVNRYKSDINRGIFLGREPTADERKLHSVRAGINEVMDEHIAPGVSFDTVIEAVQEYVDERGAVLQENHGAPFLGHTIGMENYNPPNLTTSEMQPEYANEDGDVVFEPGMMFTYEMPVELPGKDTPFFNVEDNVVVTESGVETMNPMLSRELRVKT